MDIFSDDNRRNPYPLYAQMRSMAPVFKVPLPLDAWMIFDYEGVKRALSDHESFSNRVPAPANWFIFEDPPKHTKLRALVSTSERTSAVCAGRRRRHRSCPWRPPRCP